MRDVVGRSLRKPATKFNALPGGHGRVEVAFGVAKILYIEFSPKQPTFTRSTLERPAWNP